MTILNTTPIIHTPGWPCLVLLLLLAVGLTLVIANEFDRLWLSISGTCLVVIGIVLLWCLVLGKFDRDTGRVRYEVLINDAAAFTDIMDNYDIIEQRGEIWVLEDKEDSGDTAT